MTHTLFSRIDDMTAILGSQVWTSLQHGTVLVLVTALFLWALGRRVPAGVHALLWTVALVKFVVPCGPALIGSFSGGLYSVGDPISVSAEDVLMGDVHPWIFYTKIFLLSAYAIGVLVLGATAIRRWRRHARRAAGLPAAAEPTRALVGACARRIGIRAPDVRVSDEPVGPHVAGLFHPILVLPRWLDDQPASEEAFILHELAHLERRDHWLLLAIAFVEIVFFFWPPVRFAARRLRSCREAACDETAVTHGPLGAAAYARSLVGVAARCCRLERAGGLMPSAVSTRLEERVDYLLAPRRRTGRLWLVALVAVWGVWTLAGARASAPPRPTYGPCPQEAAAAAARNS